MKAIGVRNYGGPEELQVLELPDPEPGEAEVRIRVHAAAVNPTDVVQREGFGGRWDPGFLPHVPGVEGAGEIERLGHGVGDRLHEGQLVMGLALPPGPRPGFYAEQVVVPAASVIPVPDGMSLVDASALLMNALTARMALDHLGLRADDAVAVTGAAGVLGSLVVQLAKADGLRVIADAAPADESLVRSFGADLIVARGDDVADRIRALVPLGVPGLVDCATMHALTLPALADGGRLASVRGWRPPVERDIAVALVLVPQRAGDTTTLQEIAQLADKGVLVPRVARVMPAGQAVDAHRLLAAGGLRGRIVLDFTVGVPHSLPNTNLEH